MSSLFYPTWMVNKWKHNINVQLAFNSKRSNFLSTTTDLSRALKTYEWNSDRIHKFIMWTNIVLETVNETQ